MLNCICVAYNLYLQRSLTHKIHLTWDCDVGCILHCLLACTASNFLKWHLRRDTFYLIEWYWLHVHMVPSFHFFYFCWNAFRLLFFHTYSILLSYVWIWNAVFFVYIPSSYPALALHQSSVRLNHASTSYAELILFIFLWFWLHKAISENRKEKSKLGDVGGPPHRRKQRLSRFATATANEVEVPSLHDEFISRTPPSQVLALSWQCDNWFHVAYVV